MAYFDDLYDDVLNTLQIQHATNKRMLEGQAAGATREGEARLAMAAQKGGYAGSPVQAALGESFNKKLQKDLGDRLQALSSNYLGQRAGIQKEAGMARANERMQRDIANQQMWGNVIGGLGGLTGTVSRLAGWGQNNEMNDLYKDYLKSEMGVFNINPTSEYSGG